MLYELILIVRDVTSRSFFPIVVSSFWLCAHVEISVVSDLTDEIYWLYVC